MRIAAARHSRRASHKFNISVQNATLGATLNAFACILNHPRNVTTGLKQFTTLSEEPDLNRE